MKIKRLRGVFVSKESRNLKIKEDEIKDAKWFALKEIKKLRIHPDAIKALKDAGLLR